MYKIVTLFLSLFISVQAVTLQSFKTCFTEYTEQLGQDHNNACLELFTEGISEIS
jgi:hypothetical protein